jgi:selenocysteine lyase/cysteine desulfurase
MLDCKRELFDLDQEVTYLNCAFMGPLPKLSLEVGRAAMGREAKPWNLSVDNFFSHTARARELVAGLMEADKADIAIVPSVSYGIATAAVNLKDKVGEGDEILVLDEQFPSNVYAWRELAKERGAKIVTVPRPSDDDWTSAVLSLVGDRTRIAALPACHWSDGTSVELPVISDRLKEVGAALVLDLTQSLGAEPFSVKEVEADFVVCASYKWLLGPYGVGFMYVNPIHHGGNSLEKNWLPKKGSSDFAGLVHYRDEYEPGARRFDVGESSHFTLMPVAVSSLEMITSFGVSQINGYIETLTDEIAKRAMGMGLGVAPRQFRSAHIVGLRLPGKPAEGLTEHLASSGVSVSLRGESIRVSPNIYNNLSDIEHLFDVLGKWLL